jgi:CRISPR-associated endonuclease Cas1
MPDGLLPEMPEQARVQLAPGSCYALGFTLIDESTERASERIRSLVRGLRLLGQRPPGPNPPALGGNFEVALVEDLVAGLSIQEGHRFLPIPEAYLLAEGQRLSGCDSVTLRFVSPLLAERTKEYRNKNPDVRQAYMDGNWFDAAVLTRRLFLRLKLLGFPFDVNEAELKKLVVLRNQLIWFNFSYGTKDRRKAKHGAMGRIVWQGVSERVAAALVLGQFVHIGGALNFGFGRYRIEELGAPSYPCSRWKSLAELALGETQLDLLAAEMELPSGILEAAARAIRNSSFQPEPHTRLVIQPDSRKRTLSIPSRRDRALQRGIHQFLAQAVDRLLEDSSIAYRRGLGLRTATERLKKAISKGYAWALKSDFHEFFDNISHDLLHQRLDAMVGDDQLVALIMDWVVAGSPFSGRGIPTGSPISPLIANLFLDSFDENVASTGGLLIRYADDFLILYRTEEEAAAAGSKAEGFANSICLALNEQKTKLINLREPFEFLGFKFQSEERWEHNANRIPVRIHELGWIKRPANQADGERRSLPGESSSSENGETTVICGPNVQRLSAQGKKLIVDFSDGTITRSIPTESVSELILIDPPELTRAGLNAILNANICCLLIDSLGEFRGKISASENVEQHLANLAQLQGFADNSIRLEIARRLVIAKLRNYAALAALFPGRYHDLITPKILRDCAAQAESVSSIDALLGIEGKGAARWYTQFHGRLPKQFSFERRIAPRAEDPVNAMLNLGQTILHNLSERMLLLSGLSPATGFLHAPRPGHAALASDMQEPFRHLIDRSVMEVLSCLSPADFEVQGPGPSRLRIRPRAVKLFLGTVHGNLALTCRSFGSSSLKSYRLHLLGQTRSLKNYLLSPGTSAFSPFQHP